MTLTDREAFRAGQAKAEELRCRNVIEAAGWRVTHVTTRPGDSWYSIVNKDHRHQYGTPAELARQVTKQQPGDEHERHQQRHRQSRIRGEDREHTERRRLAQSTRKARRHGCAVRCSNPDNPTVKK